MINPGQGIADYDNRTGQGQDEPGERPPWRRAVNLVKLVAAQDWQEYNDSELPAHTDRGAGKCRPAGAVVRITYGIRRVTSYRPSGASQFRVTGCG